MSWGTQRQYVVIDFNDSEHELSPAQVVGWVEQGLRSFGGYTNTTVLVNVSEVEVKQVTLLVVE